MEQISMREFQLNANKYLSRLPIELTKYGRVVALVSAPENFVKKNSVEISVEKTKEDAFKELKKTVPNVLPKQIWLGGKKYNIYPDGREELA
jgi:hypothetical protein